MKRFICLTIALLFLFTSCGIGDIPLSGGYVSEGTDAEGNPVYPDEPEYTIGAETTESFIPEGEGGVTADVTDIGFEHVVENIETTMTVECTSGTPNAYTLADGVLKFSGIAADSIYTVRGNLGGYILIDVGENYKFELILEGALIQCSSTSPVIVQSGDRVTVTAKNETENYIYDLREAVDSTAPGVYSGAIHAECDLQIGGKGSLTVESKNNNGIHTKDDLTVKNLSLTVTCIDNALKGNDSVTVESGTIVLISRGGDGIKTSNSDISEKGNQRGDIKIIGGQIDIYSAADGIDASHDAIVEGNAVLNIYTDKYSDYSEEVTATSESIYYIRFNLNNYNFSIKYTNDAGESIWKTAKLEQNAQGGGMTPPSEGGRPGATSGRPGQPQSSNYLYKVDKPAGYSKMQIFIYSSGQATEQDTDYALASEVMTVNDSYDMIVFESTGGSLRMSWSNYSTSSKPGGFPGGGGMGGPGGFGDGNSEKSDHSAKGIKAANEVRISGGNIFIKSYDDAIHANADTALENGQKPTGNLTVSGGKLTLYSNDDGLHADGKTTVKGGIVNITNSYEGIEGTSVLISSGDVSIVSKDDGINSTTSSGVGIEIAGGKLYIYAGGDGIDSNSRTSYQGIVFSGGKTVVISTSGGNSAIDSEQGYDYTGGYVLAIMPSGGMSSESTHGKNFSSVGQKKNVSLSSGAYLTVGDIVTVKMPKSISAIVIFLGDTKAAINSASSSDATFDANGVAWEVKGSSGSGNNNKNDVNSSL